MELHGKCCFDTKMPHRCLQFNDIIYIYMIYMPFASQNLLCWPHFEKSGGSHMTEKWHQLDGNMVK